MFTQKSETDSFSEFVMSNERHLRESLSAACGDQIGREAAAEALEYGWENWDRLRVMENPVGYLFKVGRGRGRRMLSRSRPVFERVDPIRLPDVEPKLPDALARLSERQRLIVILIHCDQWSQGEVAKLLGLSRSSVRNHLDRAMGSLRKTIGGVS
jgi:DNA-directed RNA polymerase specialized sigma24 family protein